MCVGFWSLGHRDHALVLCTNRDEYLSRPTESAHWHSFKSLEEPIASRASESIAKADLPETDCEGSVLSGIDTYAGGTWFGINKRGEVALLTNITEPVSHLSSSRGHLCSSFLRPDPNSPTPDLSQFAADLMDSNTRYSGFNMLLLAPSCVPHTDSQTDHSTAYDLHYKSVFLSNNGAGNPIEALPLSEQSFVCGGISNGVLSGIDPFTKERTDSEWPKITQGKHMLSKILATQGSEEFLVEQLFDLLRMKTHSPPSTRQEFKESILIDPVDLSAVRKGPSFAQTSRPNVNVGHGADHQESGTMTALPPESSGHDETSLHSPDYATRLSTVLLVRKNGEVMFIERDVWLSITDAKPELADHKAEDNPYERRFRFRLESR